MFRLQYQNGKKTKKRKNFSGLQHGIIRGLQIGAGFLGLQVWARWITNRGTFRDFKSGQGLQIGAEQLMYNLNYITWVVLLADFGV